MKTQENQTRTNKLSRVNKRYESAINNFTEMKQTMHPYYAKQERHSLSEEECFKAIMELQGVEELKALVLNLRKVQKNLEKYAVADYTLPSYLWIVKSGCGITTCINAFAEYLCIAGIFEFRGKVKYFEHKLGYVTPLSSKEFRRELDKIDEAINSNTGFNRYFKGLVCINIDDWIRYTNEKYFYDFLDYMANKDNILAILYINSDNKHDIASVEAPVKARLRSETVWLKFPNAEELVEGTVTDFFKERGFNLSNDAKSLLKESIEVIVTGNHFKGYKTINQLNEDIFKKLLVSDFSGNEISAEMLTIFGFDKNSSYVKMKTFVELRKVGFGLHNEEYIKQ